MIDITRNQRYGKAAVLHGAPYDPDWQTMFVDTLANMHHAADVLGVNWYRALQSAEMHVEAERYETSGEDVL